MTNFEKASVYGVHLDNFQNESVREIVLGIINSTPTLFFGASTSSSGKYHPTATNGLMGLVKHSVATMLIAKDLLRSDISKFILQKEEISDLDKEILLAAALLHDNAKYGVEEHTRKEGKIPTTTDHPNLVSKLAEQAGLFSADQETVEILKRILKLIETHMGQWDCDGKLRKPSSPEENFIHLCDYFASRKTFDIVSELSLPDSLDNTTLEWFQSQV